MLCNKKILVKLRGKIYYIMVQLALLYGSEYWPVKHMQVQKLSIAEIRMIRWICGHIIMDKIRNQIIRENVGVAPIEDKMRETKLG